MQVTAGNILLVLIDLVPAFLEILTDSREDGC